MMVFKCCLTNVDVNTGSLRVCVCVCVCVFSCVWRVRYMFVLYRCELICFTLTKNGGV